MTKPRRYSGKSHPATQTQEQTILTSTETQALKNKTLQIDDETAQIWWKISSRDPNSGADETNDDGN